MEKSWGTIKAMFARLYQAGPRAASAAIERIREITEGQEMKITITTVSAIITRIISGCSGALTTREKGAVTEPWAAPFGRDNRQRHRYAGAGAGIGAAWDSRRAIIGDQMSGRKQDMTSRRLRRQAEIDRSKESWIDSKRKGTVTQSSVIV